MIIPLAVLLARCCSILIILPLLLLLLLSTSPIPITATAIPASSAKQQHQGLGLTPDADEHHRHHGPQHAEHGDEWAESVPCLSQVYPRDGWSTQSDREGSVQCEYHLEASPPKSKLLQLTLSLQPRSPDMPQGSRQRQQQDRSRTTSSSTSTSAPTTSTTTTTATVKKKASSGKVENEDRAEVAGTGTTAATTARTLKTSQNDKKNNDNYNNSNINTNNANNKARQPDNDGYGRTHSTLTSNDNVSNPSPKVNESADHHLGQGLLDGAIPRNDDVIISKSYDDDAAPKSGDYDVRHESDDVTSGAGDILQSKSERDNDDVIAKQVSQTSEEKADGGIQTTADLDGPNPASICILRLKLTDKDNRHNVSQEWCVYWVSNHTDSLIGLPFSFYYRGPIRVIITWTPRFGSEVHLKQRMVPLSGVKCSFPCEKGHLCLLDSQRCDDHQDCPDGEDESPELCPLRRPMHRASHGPSVLVIGIIMAVVVVVVLLVVCACFLHRRGICQFNSSRDALLRQHQRPHSHSSEMYRSPSGSMQDSSGQYDQRVALLPDGHSHPLTPPHSSSRSSHTSAGGQSANGHHHSALPSSSSPPDQRQTHAPLSPYFQPTQSAFSSPLSSQCNGRGGLSSASRNPRHLPSSSLHQGLSSTSPSSSSSSSSKPLSSRGPQSYPPRIALSRDGEEGYKAAQLSLNNHHHHHHQHQHHHDWLTQNIFRAPPNKTIYDRDSPPPPYSVSAPTGSGPLGSKSSDNMVVMGSVIVPRMNGSSNSSISSRSSGGSVYLNNNNNNNNTNTNNNNVNNNNNNTFSKHNNNNKACVSFPCPPSSQGGHLRYSEPTSCAYTSCANPVALRTSEPPPDYHQVAAMFSERRGSNSIASQQRGHNSSSPDSSSSCRPTTGQLQGSSSFVPVCTRPGLTGSVPSPLPSSSSTSSLPMDNLSPEDPNLPLRLSPSPSSGHYGLPPLAENHNTFVVTNGSPSVCPGPDTPSLTAATTTSTTTMMMMMMTALDNTKANCLAGAPSMHHNWSAGNADNGRESSGSNPLSDGITPNNNNNSNILWPGAATTITIPSLRPAGDSKNVTTATATATEASLPFTSSSSSPSSHLVTFEPKLASSMSPTVPSNVESSSLYTLTNNSHLHHHHHHHHLHQLRQQHPPPPPHPPHYHHHHHNYNANSVVVGPAAGLCDNNIATTAAVAATATPTDFCSSNNNHNSLCIHNNDAMGNDNIYCNNNKEYDDNGNGGDGGVERRAEENDDGRMRQESTRLQALPLFFPVAVCPSALEAYHNNHSNNNNNSSINNTLPSSSSSSSPPPTASSSLPLHHQQLHHHHLHLNPLTLCPLQCPFESWHGSQVQTLSSSDATAHPLPAHPPPPPPPPHHKPPTAPCSPHPHTHGIVTNATCCHHHHPHHHQSQSPTCDGFSTADATKDVASHQPKAGSPATDNALLAGSVPLLPLQASLGSSSSPLDPNGNQHHRHHLHHPGHRHHHHHQHQHHHHQQQHLEAKGGNEEGQSASSHGHGQAACLDKAVVAEDGVNNKNCDWSQSSVLDESSSSLAERQTDAPHCDKNVNSFAASSSTTPSSSPSSSSSSSSAATTTTTAAALSHTHHHQHHHHHHQSPSSSTPSLPCGTTLPPVANSAATPNSGPTLERKDNNNDDGGDGETELRNGHLPTGISQEDDGVPRDREDGRVGVLSAVDLHGHPSSCTDAQHRVE